MGKTKTGTFRGASTRQQGIATLAFFVMFASVIGGVGLSQPATAQQEGPTPITNPDDLVTALAGNAEVLEISDMTLDGNPIVIQRDVTIQGVGELAADSTVTVVKAGGNVAGQAFVVESGDVTFRNLAITGADTRNKGGAIAVNAGATVTLEDVYLHGNSADEGGALYNAGTAVVRRSTLQGNVASRKGGGIENDGTLSLVNSTLTENVGKGGGGLSTAGTAYLSFVTVYTNESTNKIGAGTLRNGGTLVVKNSIVANNVGSDGAFHDCSGTPNFIGVNLVSDSQGCNPGDETIDLSSEPGNPTLDMPGPGDFGGPTPTHPLLEDDDGSLLAIDAITDCTVLDETGFDDPYATGDVGTDQRGVTRDASCDIGAYELALDIEVSMTTSADTVEVGAVTVPLENLPTAVNAAEEAGTTVSAQLSAIQLSAIQLSAIQLSAIQLSAIDTESAQLSAIQLSAIQLSAIQLSAILTEALQLSAIQLSAITLSEIQLSAISPNYDTDLVTIGDLLCDSNGTNEFCGTPLQALTLTDLIAAEPGITLADIDFRSTQLSAIQLSAIVLIQLPLDSLVLDETDNRQAWCDALGITSTTECDTLDLNLSLLDLADDYSSLESAQLSAIQLSAIQLSAIGESWSTLSDAQLSAIQLSAIQLSAINWTATQLSAIQLSAIHLTDAQLSAICGSPTCAEGGETLGELAEIGALVGTVADLIRIFTEEPLASSGYTLVDLLFGLIPATDMAWEDLGEDLELLPLADASDNTGTTRTGVKQPTFDYQIALEVTGGAVDVGLALPAGFSFASPTGAVPDTNVPPVRLNGTGDTSLIPSRYDATSTCLDGSTVPSDGSYLVFPELSLSPGTHTLEIPVWAGTTLGTFSAEAHACAVSGTQETDAGPATASIGVIEGAPASQTIDAGDLEVAHIASAGEIERYSFTLDSRSQARIILETFDDTDLDLVLFGPPLPQYLRGEPQTGFGLVEDFTYDLTPDDDVLDPNTLDDIPLDPPSGSVVHAVSASRDGDEVIDTGALRPGTYTIQVSGYNGATSDAAFALRLRTTPLADVGPCASGVTWPSVSGTPPVPQGINTVFLYNATTYGDTTNLLSLIGSDDWSAQGIAPAAVPIDGYPSVVTALNAWANEYCDPEAANGVVRAIGSDILDHILAEPSNDLQYIVIIGGDEQIPFARNTDGAFVSNEAVHGLSLSNIDAVKAALVEGYYLTDTPYAGMGYRVADRELFIPTVAIGRLVEDDGANVPGIEATIAAHLANGGFLTDGSANGDAVVAGYDFLLDGAQAAADALGGDFNVVTTGGGNSLLSETWTGADLSSALNTDSSLAVIEAHYDESRLLPANENLSGTEDHLFTVEEYLALENRSHLMVTPGCHSGLSISQMVNWADSNALVGNTGYGYGDTEIVSLSERLVELTTERIGSMPVGVAVRNALNAYAEQLYTITPYDMKIMEEFTLYGLPMARAVGASAASATSSFGASAAPEGTEPRIFTDPFTGLPSSIADLGYSDLTSVGSSPDAWVNAGYDLLTVRGRAVLPTDSVEVSSTGRIAAGVLVTALSSPAKTSFSPLMFDPQAGEQYTPGSTTDDARTTAGETTFPASVQGSVKHVLGDDGNWHDRVVIVPARHYTESGTDELEVFTDVNIQTLYRPDDWSGAAATPYISRSIGRTEGEVVEFDITVPPLETGTTERVLVLFRNDLATGPWQSIDLASADGVNWTGRRSGVATGTFEFIVQAVSSSGDVASATGKAINFETISAAIDQAVSVAVFDAGDPAFGWYPGRDGVDVVARADGTNLCRYVLDGSEITLSGTTADIDIEGDGEHLLAVYGGDGCGDVAFLQVAIDGTPPITEASLEVEDGSLNLTVTASDVGVGADLIEYRINGGAWLVYDEAVSLDLSETATIEHRAIDYVGNVGTPGSITVDLSPPTVSATATTDDGTTYPSGTWSNADSVTVTITASDADSGLDSIDWSYDDVTGESADSPATVGPISSEDITTITYTATDTLGNQSAPQTFDIQLDRTDPNATLALPEFDVVEQTASYSCDDAGDGLSPVASCVVTIDGVIVAGDDPADSPDGGTFTLPADAIDGVRQVAVTAADAAGNTFTVTAPYGAEYGFCYLYDPDRETSGSVAVRIRITTNTWDMQCDGTENNISRNNLAVFAYRLDGGPVEPQDSGRANSDPTYEFRYDRQLDGYIYNLNVELSPGEHILEFTVDQDWTDTDVYPDAEGLIVYPARFSYK